MKVAVIGSRSFADYEKLRVTLNGFVGPFVSEIISGGAKGADSLAERYAKEKKLNTQIFRPAWDKYGKSAGYLRNQEIIKICDMVVVFWDGESKGSKHSINLARKARKNTISSMSKCLYLYRI